MIVQPERKEYCWKHATSRYSFTTLQGAVGRPFWFMDAS